MNPGVLTNVLAKLKEKTGREWGLNDLMRLARRLPKINDKNVDLVLKELADMGLSVSPETRNKIKEQLQGGKKLSPQWIGELLEGRKEEPPKKAVVKIANPPIPRKRSAISKRHGGSLAERILRMQKRRKRRSL